MNDRPSFAEVLQTFLGLLIDGAAFCAKYGWDKVRRYAAFVWSVTRVCLFTIAGYGLIVLVCLLFQVGWPPLYSGFFVVLGLAGATIAILMYPFWLSWEIIRKLIPEAEKSLMRLLRFVADIAFWSSMLAIYCYIVPVWNNPGAMPLFLLVVFALALATITGRIAYNPRFIQAIRTVQLVGLLVLVIVSFTFPQTARRILSLKGGLDTSLVERFADPKPLKVSRFEDLEFFNPASGRPQVWMDKSAGGDLAFYSGEGFSSVTRKPYQLVESEKQVQEIRAWFSKREREQQTAQAAAARSAAEQAAIQNAKEETRHREEQARLEKERLAAVQSAEQQATLQLAEKARREEELRKRADIEAWNRLRSSILVSGLSTNSASDIDVTFVANLSPATAPTLNNVLKRWSSTHGGVSEKDAFVPNFRNTSHFKALFVRDGTFLKEVKAIEVVDFVIAIAEHITSTLHPHNPAVEQAEITLEIVIWDAALASPLKSFSLLSNGSAFTRNAAIQEAAGKVATTLNQRLEEELTPCLTP